MSNPASFPPPEVPSVPPAPVAPVDWTLESPPSFPDPRPLYGTPTTPPYAALPGAPGPGSRSRMSGLGTASVVLGGVALLLSPVPLLNVLGAVGALVGVVLGVIALVQRDKRKLTAIIGVPVSALSLALSVLLIVVYAIAFNGWVDSLDDGYSLITEQEPVVFEPGSTVPAEAGVGMSPDNPAPFGSTVRFDNDPDESFAQGWEVTLDEPNLDATDEVAAAYPLSDLGPGEQYASVPVTLTNLGSIRETPAVQLKFEYVTSGFQVVEKPWINMPGTVEAIGGLEPGASSTGNVIIDIPTADVGQGVWGVRFYLGSQTVYFGNLTGT
ncbi:hypothetical protein J7E29_11590 [Streptomyces sp. ISL-90]|nr:hypothetical protein [Streptomyces sp. ISL-90]